MGLGFVDFGVLILVISHMAPRWTEIGDLLSQYREFQ